jgi:hypothetical protein
MARIKVETEEEPARSPLKMTDEKLIHEFDELLLIDKTDLDTMLEQSADLIYRVSEMLTERVAERDAAKLDVAEAEARADASIRKDAQLADEKITADQVKAEIKIDKKVIAAVNRHADLVYWVNRWQGMQSAFSARQSAIRGLVDLYGNNYWADTAGGGSASKKAVVRSKAGELAREALKAERQRRAKG